MINNLKVHILFIFAFTAIFILYDLFSRREAPSRSYQSYVVLENDIDGGFYTVGREWVLLNQDNISYRFVAEQGSHIEDSSARVLSNIGQRYVLHVSSVRSHGRPPTGYEFNDRIAIFKGQRINTYRYEIDSRIACMIVQDTEVMRCFSQP